MLYNFIDVNEQQTKASLPSEAMNFNGSFLEDLVPGYRTLSVVGRELALLRYKATSWEFVMECDMFMLVFRKEN